MGGAAALIILKIKTKNPIELGDFVAEFTSVASQYDKFIRENHPDLGPEARIYVKQIKKGSIIAELLPFVPFAMFAPQIVSSIEQVNAVNDFVRNYGSKLRSYFKKGRRGTGRVEIGPKRLYGHARGHRKRSRWVCHA
jgi:hypothetical protein